MPTKIKNSVVVITGASSGIGRATALEFACKGAFVVAAARRRDPLAELEREGESLKGRIAAVPADVTVESSVNALASDAIATFGRIDVWVNNAAVTAFGRIEELPLEDYQRIWDTNVMGYVRGIRAALPYMREQGRGTIINVSSVVGRVGQPYAVAYTMTKHAIRALSIGLRQELLVNKEKNIAACTVMPGSIDTPLFQHGANYTGWFAKPMSPVYPPEQVAKTIVACARNPRPEVFVGNAARAMHLQTMVRPRAAERSLARMVDNDHFDKRKYSEPNRGNLYEPVPYGAATAGDWDGRKGRNLRRLAIFGSGVAALWFVIARD